MTCPTSIPNLSCYQSAIEDTLTGRGTITRPGTYASDGQGGGTAAYTPVGTADCSIVKGKDAREIEIGGQIRAVVPFYVSVPGGTLVKSRDRIQSGGFIYEVVGSDYGTSSGFLTKVECVRLDG